MRINISTTLLSFAFLGNLFGQADIENRIEIESRETINETIIPFGENGFIFSSEQIDRGDRTLNFDLYSNDLEKEESFSTVVGKKYFNEKEFQNEDITYQLHTDRKGNFTLLSINTEDIEFNVIQGVLPKRNTPKSFKILNETAYIVARYKKTYQLLKMDINSGKVEVIPIEINGQNPKRISINNTQFLEKENELFIALDVYVSRKNTKHYLMRIDSDENTSLFEVNPFSPNNERLVDISMSKIGDDKYVMSGTYSTDKISHSAGIYFALVDKTEVTKINYYNFLELDDFLSYLPQKKQDKIKKKKKRKKRKGKEFDISYSIASHDIIQKEDGSFIFIGEAYYPTFRTITTYDANGVPSTTQVFDGFQYTHAIVAKYSKDGELVWDSCFEMYPNYKPFHVTRFISINQDNEDYLSTLFAGRRTIFSKSIDYKDGSIIREKESNKIELPENEKLKYSTSFLKHWYDDNFLLYGSQVIKDKKAAIGNRKRFIFFISKVNYRP